MVFFADDTAVVSSGCTWDDVYEQASADIVKIKRWLDQNTLTLYVKKTKCLTIVFKRESDPSPRQLSLHSCGDPQSVACGCSVIERVECYKYL
jgi:hypothetical protein